MTSIFLFVVICASRVSGSASTLRSRTPDHHLPEEGWLTMGHPSHVMFLPESRADHGVEAGDDFDYDIPPTPVYNPETDTAESPTQDDNVTFDLRMEKTLSNVTKETGDNVRFRCDVRGGSQVQFRWYKNEAPVEEERGRVEIKKYNPPGIGRFGSRLRIVNLDTHDTGYYKCEADNKHAKVESTGILIVRAGHIQPPAAIPNFPNVLPHFPALAGGT